MIHPRTVDVVVSIIPRLAVTSVLVVALVSVISAVMASVCVMALASIAGIVSSVSVIVGLSAVMSLVPIVLGIAAMMTFMASTMTFIATAMAFMTTSRMVTFIALVLRKRWGRARKYEPANRNGCCDCFRQLHYESLLELAPAPRHRNFSNLNRS